MKSERDPLVISRDDDPDASNSINNQPSIVASPPQRSNVLEYPEYRYVLSDESAARFDSAIILMLAIGFLSSISFSIALPSLWHYVHQLNGKLDILGWAIALHSGGSIVSAPFLTAWSRKRSLREVLTGSLIMMTGGGVMHGMAMSVPMLLSARFLIGVGSANYVITTAYLSQVSRRTRDRALMYNGMVAIAGFIVGPAIAAAFYPLKIDVGSGYTIDAETAPGYFIAALSLCAAILTLIAPISILRKRVRRRGRPESYDPSSSQPQVFNNSATYDIAGSLLNYGMANSGYYYTEVGSVEELPTMLRDLWNNRRRLPLAQLLVCFFVYFAITLAFTVWETLGPALTQDMLHWDVVYNGLMFAGMGVSAVLTLVLLFSLTKVFAGRLILPATALLMVVGATLLAVLRPWTLPIFISSLGLIAVGYTGSVSMVIHVYGRVLELSTEVPTPPAAVGWLSTCGTVARVFGPVCVAYLLMHAGTNAVLWVMVFAATIPAVVVFCVLLAYKRLPP